MEIKLAKNIGFCNGVTKSVDETKRLLSTSNNIYALGELVHNDLVINELKEKGLEIINELPEKECDVIIRAHGVSKEIYEEADKRKINLIDLTCPKVLAIHKLAEKLKKEYFIILIGKKSHPEVIGTISYCGDNSIIIEDEKDIDNLKIKNDKIAIISQTTYSLEKFEKICNLIKEKYNNKKIKIYNTICNATKDRQEEIKMLAKEVDAILIIGDKKSSNTNKLYELSKEINHNTFFTQNENDLDISILNKFNTIGIATGASTPKEFTENIINKIKTIDFS